MTAQTELPVPVLSMPHWRVTIRPEHYEANLIPTLGECFGLVERNRVRLRGWDYPHISHSSSGRGQGGNWVASWDIFRGHIEHWRMYQSGQFLHLFAVREASDPQWRETLESYSRFHICRPDLDWTKVPGYISLINLLLTVTEIFEFAARLAESGLYAGQVSVQIGLIGIDGFLLTTDPDRMWSEYCAASEDTLENTWTTESSSLVSASAQHSLAAASWFYERFGWFSPSVAVLKKDQEKFLQRSL